MHPWIAEQANREHIAELRSLGRPFGGSLGVRRINRLRLGRGARNRATLGVTGHSRRVSIGF